MRMCVLWLTSPPIFCAFHHSEVVFGVLVPILDLDCVAGQLGLSCARQAALVVLPGVTHAILWPTHRPRPLGSVTPWIRIHCVHP